MYCVDHRNFFFFPLEKYLLGRGGDGGDAAAAGIITDEN